MRLLARLLAASILVLSVAVPSATAADPAPFGHACTAENGVRFCPTPDSAGRVPSWDGVPLDADVTLPPDGSGPWPTIVMIHGWGGDKTDFESKTPDGDGSSTYHYTNNWFAKQGYAVLNYTARGFGASCGKQDPSAPSCYAIGKGGYIHLKDQRIEAHDTQYLLGVLVDEGIAQPNALGATGISYGGGESIELAFLNDKTRNTSDAAAPNALVPWTSPHGTPLALTAAWPRWPWSDLVYSLVPNGRALDFKVEPPGGVSRDPIGIPIATYIEGLFALGNATGNYAPPGADPSADLIDWHTRVDAGEPYADPYVKSIVDEIYSFHSGVGLRLAQGASTPAPMLIENGWTDDLFPPMEALRVYNALRAGDPNAPVSLQFGDLGHARGQNKTTVNHFFNDQGSAFFDGRLKGSSATPPPAPGAVTTFTQTCPFEAADGGPFSAGSWSAIHPGAVRFANAAAQTVTSAGGNPQTGKTIDPISGDGACAQVDKETAPGTAVVESPKSTGFTLMGLPAVQADIQTTGPSGQLDSRLWDVAPNGKQTLVSRGAYRLTDNQTGKAVVFQLHGNGWHFAPGHIAKLELLGNDAPYLRASNTQFSVQVSNVVVELPTLEGPASTAALSPGSSGQTVQPLLGQGKVLSAKSLRRTTPRLRLSVKPRRVHAGKRTRFRMCVTARVGRKTVHVRRAMVSFAGKRAKTRRNGCARLTAKPNHAGRQKARARKHGYRTGVAYVRVRR
ncbi:MAG: CocE/NonD family hydrolase [Thermoleophilaceae bacterium]